MATKERPRVWVAITGKSKKIVLAGLRGDTCNNAGQWGLIGGQVDPGENARQAAVRELKEEIGITVNPNELKIVGECQHMQRQCTFFSLPRSRVNLDEVRFTHEVTDFEYGDDSWQGRVDLHYSLDLYLKRYYEA